MPKNITSVRLADELIDALDRKAAAEGLTRSQLIVKAVERVVAEECDWSPAFLKAIGARDAEVGAAADEMMGVIRSRRSRKAAPRL